MTTPAHPMAMIEVPHTPKAGMSVIVKLGNHLRTVMAQAAKALGIVIEKKPCVDGC